MVTDEAASGGGSVVEGGALAAVSPTMQIGGGRSTVTIDRADGRHVSYSSGALAGLGRMGRTGEHARDWQGAARGVWWVGPDK